jgi:NAD(P)-dependent dehydrogenase (short-subunit alcohol dehydrogenase family)
LVASSPAKIEERRKEEEEEEESEEKNMAPGETCLSLGQLVALAAALALAVLAWLHLERLLPPPLASRRLSLRGQVAVVTGGGRGIGRELVCALTARGASVGILSTTEDHIRDTERAAIAGAAPGARVLGLVCDVRDREAVRASLARIRRELGPVDILINNAGAVWGGSVLEAPDEQVERVLDTNLKALFWCVRACLPDMLARGRGGCIVVISSVAALQGVGFMASYTASKFGALGFCEALRHELRELSPAGLVRCVAVLPYLVDTDMFRGVPIPWAAPWIAGRPLAPRAVAERTLLAVERGEEFLVVPPQLRLVAALRLLPAVAADALTRFIGAATAMKGFVNPPRRAGR